MKWNRILLLLTVLALTGLACGLPVSLNVPLPVNAPAAQADSGLITADPNAKATPTPFQPIAPTPTLPPPPTPTPLPEPTEEPTEVFEPSGEGIVNLLVLGSDARPGGGFRTDVMMLVSINRGNGTVSVVSFPRDLYVTIPGWMTNRLNTAFGVGGFDLMAATFEYNFGVRPSYYVMTNFNGFKSIIDTLGGITIEASQELYDKCDVSWRDWQGYCYVPAGSFNLDGESALWYVRSRYSSSDFDRLRRAQEVTKGIFVKLMSLNAIARAPELYDNFRSSVETNLGIDEILGLLPVASAVLNDSGRVYQYAITPAQASPYVTPEGAYVLWPDLYAIQAIVREAIYR